MDIKQALDMAESLISDNEQSISSLGTYGDEVAILLLDEIERLRLLGSEKPHELTKREAAARQHGFEEGKQAGRDELQKELSEQEPMWWELDGKIYSAKQRDDAGWGDYYPNQTALIPRPLPPEVKGG